MIWSFSAILLGSMTQGQRNILYGVAHESIWGLAFALMDPGTILQLAMHDLGGNVSLAGIFTGLFWAICALPGAFSAFILPARFSDPRFCAMLHLPAVIFTGLLACLFYFFPEMNSSLRLHWLLLLSCGFFINLGMIGPHWISLLHRCVPEDFHGRYFAWGFSLSNLGGIFTGALAAHWISQGGLRLGYGRSFAICFILQLLSASLLLLLKPLKERPAPLGAFSDFAKSQWRLITEHKGFAALCLLYLLMQLSGAPGNFYTECIKSRGLSTSWWELFIPAKNIGGVLGSFIIGYIADHYGPRLGLYLAFCLMAISLGVMALEPSPGLYALAFFGGGFFGSAFPVINIYLFLHLSAPGESASFSGTFSSLTAPLIFLAPCLMASAAEKAGYNQVFLASAFLCALALLFVRQRGDFGLEAEKAVP